VKTLTSRGKALLFLWDEMIVKGVVFIEGEQHEQYC